jgi:hypothetical protein
MKHIALLPLCLLPLLLLAVGCGPSAEQKLIGSWEGKLEISESALAEAQDNPFAAALGSAMKDMVANLRATYTFNADKTFEVVLPGPLGTMNMSGTWEVVSQSGDEVTIRMNPQQGASIDRAVTFIDADHFETADDKGVLKFTRLVE